MTLMLIKPTQQTCGILLHPMKNVHVQRKYVIKSYNFTPNEEPICHVQTDSEKQTSQDLLSGIIEPS